MSLYRQVYSQTVRRPGRPITKKRAARPKEERLKKLTYYHETKRLLRFIGENWPDYSLKIIETILTDAKEKIKEKIETEITIENINLFSE